MFNKSAFFNPLLNTLLAKTLNGAIYDFYLFSHGWSHFLKLLSITTLCKMAPVTGYNLQGHLRYRNSIWNKGNEKNKTLFMHKSVFTLPKSFTGHYTKDQPNFTLQNNLTSQKLLWHEQVVNFKDFSRPDKEIKYFSRRLLKFKTFKDLWTMK